MKVVVASFSQTKTMDLEIKEETALDKMEVIVTETKIPVKNTKVHQERQETSCQSH